MGASMWGVLLVLVQVHCILAGPNEACRNNGWAMCDYVHRADGNYRWEVLSEQYTPASATWSFTLNLTSQAWKDTSWTNWPTWWHYLVIHVPDDRRTTEHALIYIGERSNTQGPPSINQGQGNRTKWFASETGAVSAVLNFIPNQPISFMDSPGNRWEDDSISWTWQYNVDDFAANDNNADPETNIMMPMVKSVVRAMDCLQDFMNYDLKFVLSGVSKRAWTTWIVSGVDDRVSGAVPTMESDLNYVSNYNHMWRSFGGWAWWWWDYYLVGDVLGRINEPDFEYLASITDGGNYLEGITMPVMNVQGAEDEFFVIDDSHYFWDDIRHDQKYQWILESTSHGVGTGPRTEDYWHMLATFFISIADEFYDRPVYTYDMVSPEERSGTGSITLHSSRQDPLEIMAFSAPSIANNRRDWRRSFMCGPDNNPRDCSSGVSWTLKAVEELGGGDWRVEYDVPNNGYLAFYIQMRYMGPGGRDFWVTTEANIIPSSFPYAQCTSRAECHGDMV